ncbi:hypothetical protein AB0G05_17390 [Nonomuraea wenchangensis]
MITAGVDEKLERLPEPELSVGKPLPGMAGHVTGDAMAATFQGPTNPPRRS